MKLAFLRRRKGFSLIELLIAIVIVVLVAGIAIPLTAAYVNRRHLYNTAAQIQQDLLLIQNKAMTYGVDSGSGRFEIYFRPSQGTYYIEEEMTSDFLTNSGKIVERKINRAITMVIDGVSEGEYWKVAFDYKGIPTLGSEGRIKLVLGKGSAEYDVVISTIGRVLIVSP